MCFNWFPWFFECAGAQHDLHGHPWAFKEIGSWNLQHVVPITILTMGLLHHIELRQSYGNVAGTRDLEADSHGFAGSLAQGGPEKAYFH